MDGGRNPGDHQGDRKKVKGLISAVQFMTILRLGKAGIFEPQRMVSFFPIVGIILGGLVAGFDHVAMRLWSGSVVSLLDVIFLVVITGAFHIDGLGDTADGLFGHRDSQVALSIMKDSRIGVMGLVAVLCVLSMKWGGIMGLDANRSLWIIILPAYARGGMIFGIKFLKYGRDAGTGHALFGSRLKNTAFLGLIIPVGLSFFLGWKGICLNVVFALTIIGILMYYKKRMGCITGDMLGAMAEVTESVLFLMVSVGG